MDLVVRDAAVADADRVAALTQQLGYDVAPEVARERLGAGPGGDRSLAVAERGEDGVVGWIEARVETTFVGGRRCRVTGLVVDEAARRLGAGRALLAWAEHWARSRECAEVYLTTNVRREDAHAFYERLGWSRRKTSHVYGKKLPPGETTETG